jgi:hypothetical protein
MTSALAGLGIIKILSKVNLKSVANTKKIRALVLTGLIGWMALTTTFAYPAPENNFKMQEVFWEAEFAGVDFIIFSENLSHPTFIEGQDIMIDADWRLSAIVEGYGGMVSTFEQGNKSWMTNFIYKNESQRPSFLKNTSPWDISMDVDYVFITRIYNDVGYHIGWPVYGGENDNWFRDFPDITGWLPFNPNLHRVYSNHLMYILLPFQTSS